MLVSLLLPTTASATPGATGDGQFTVTELTASPEPPDTAPLTTLFSGTDANGDPSFPDGSGAPTTCDVSSASGVAVEFSNGGALPCGTASDGGDNNGNADYVIVDGFVIIPEGASTISLEGSNLAANGNFKAGAIHFYAAPSDDRTAMQPLGGFGVTGADPILVTTTLTLPGGSTPCAVPPGIAYRVYIFDGHSGMSAAVRWSVTGGTEDTGGAFETIPTAFLSSVSGYDNDLDGNGTADYLEGDVDNDGISDFEEMGFDPAGWDIDTDGDGIPDCEDADSDNDGLADGVDPTPTTATASDDSDTVAVGESSVVDVTVNDTEFTGPNNTVTDLSTGTASGYTISPAGVVTWDTTGVAPGTYTIDYEICNLDAAPFGGCAEATLSITVLEVPELTTVTSTNNTPGDPATIDVIGNATNLDPTTVEIIGATEPDGSLIVPNEGTWEVDPLSGVITFTPNADFTGTPTPITYTVASNDGVVSEPGTITVEFAAAVAASLPSTGSTIAFPLLTGLAAILSGSALVVVAGQGRLQSLRLPTRK